MASLIIDFERVSFAQSLFLVGSLLKFFLVCTVMFAISGFFQGFRFAIGGTNASRNKEVSSS